MKKNLLFILAVCICQLLLAQSPRKVLVEHFTQASCGPCASTNPIIHPILERNKSRLVLLTHQTSWPGVDPMNADNPGEVATRVAYYGVTGVPDTKMGGQDGGQSPTQLITDANIANSAAIESNYEISVDPGLASNYNELNPKITVKLTGPIEGNPILRVVVLEKVITWPSPPGSNGEKVFYHVVKKFLPNTGGTPISDLSNVGDSKTYTFNFKFNKLYNFRNLEVAAYIQNESTKEVAQAESKEVDYIKSPGLDIAIKYAKATSNTLKNTVCGTGTIPTITYINTGNANVTAIKFRSSVNGGPLSEYTWTGNIAFLEEKTINLSNVEIPKMLANGNTLTIEAFEVNGNADVNPINNTLVIPFDPSPATTLTSRLDVKPLTKGSLVTFTLQDDANKVIIQDGSYPTNELHSYPLNLSKDRCYTLTIDNDHTSLNGSAKLYDANNKLVMNVTLLTRATYVSDFTTYDLVLGTHEPSENIYSFSVTPNPVHDVVRLEWIQDQSGPIQIMFSDLTGKAVQSIQHHSISGSNQMEIPVDQIHSGMYLVSIHHGKNKITKRVIVE
ncbi:MAG: Omp28-related outer membrane protein [Saprospiraceae bacterium]|jgi:hypothetical protein|nr:Omp28-related outer membrane protein [Saprospiraceae bacterium]